MTEILWHGRGGQGAFTAAKLLGAAFSLGSEDHYSIAFPSFGPERRMISWETIFPGLPARM